MSADNVIADQRERLRLVYGGISAWHVLRETNFRSASHPGMWTRRAWGRRALCGALRACVVVGGDVEDWCPAEAINPDQITCARCRAQYERTHPSATGADEEV